MAGRRSLAFDADLLRPSDDEEEEEAPRAKAAAPRRLSAKAKGKRPARETVEEDEDEPAPPQPKRAYFAPVVVAEGGGRSSRARTSLNGTASGSAAASTSSGKAKPAAASTGANRQLSRAKPASKSKKAAPKPPAQTTNEQYEHHLDSSDPDGSFVFTTQPFVPSSQQGSQLLSQSNRPAPVPAPRGPAQPAPPPAKSSIPAKRPATEAPKRVPPAKKGKAAAAAPAQQTATPPPERDRRVALPERETPMLNRNASMRKAADASAVLSSGGRPGSARRTSFEMRGRRASGIGGGLSSVHPSVSDSLLYRHIDPSDPEPTRMLTLLAWAVKRARPADAVDDTVLATALEAIDGFLADVSDRTLDVDWYHRPNAGPSASSARLKPNPQNVANQEKKAKLDRWVAKINHEDQARDVNRKRYAALRVDLSRPALPLGPPDLSSPLAPLSSPADVLRYGRSIRTLVATPLSPGAAAPVREPPSATVDVEAELSLSFRSMRIQAADVRSATQQIDRYVHQADRYTAQRLGEASRALTAAHVEAPQWPLAPRSDRRPPRPDPMLLLRAISRHDPRRAP